MRQPKAGTAEHDPHRPQDTTPSAAADAPADWEEALFRDVVSADLTPEQTARVAAPQRTYPRQESVLAVHWHPEHVPLDLTMRRVAALFPNRRQELIIPTQHNELVALDGYAGVEVDCYAAQFKRKVQLLFHFRAERVARAEALEAMLAHTRRYRSLQLHAFLAALTEEDEATLREQAAATTGAPPDIVNFARGYGRTLIRLIEANRGRAPESMLKNRLVRDYFHGLRGRHDERFIMRVQAYVLAVKELVKAAFPLKHFYQATEVIEEARAHGAGIVIPHPEQFWPILLAGYDVDGYEVWNPQSRQYTEFLIHVIQEKNRSRRRDLRPLLVFMGDDCHMGEKIKDPSDEDPDKAGREVGLQPAWDELAIREALLRAGMERRRVIEEYRQRLG